jgi:hydroxyacylglutathione hydrolase
MGGPAFSSVLVKETQPMAYSIDVIACLRDNYAYLLGDGESAVLVDAPEAAPILDTLAAAGVRLKAILLTHHHGDHIDGALEIARHTGAMLVGASADAHRLPPLDIAVGDGDIFAVGPLRFSVIATPGHTLGAVAFYAIDAAAVFTGDTLFSLGCGRLFEGTAEQMWRSISRLMTLPDDTAVYPGHEYTAANGRFALSVDADNRALAERVGEVEELTTSGRPTVPSTIGLERATNPFMRAGDADLSTRVGLPGRSEVEVFAELRRRKDVF